MPASPQNLPKPVTVGDHQFRIGGKVATVYSGAVHYWRLDRSKWSDILDKVIGMGFNTITSYIPWEAHEIRRGEFDFGQVNPSNDIDAFLTLVEEKGMNAIVRPGPQINSELTWFGYPGRILDDPEMQALNSQGTKAVLTQVPRPIPALSYTSEKFFEETALWYDAICPILAKHKKPGGCLTAVQVDNEMAFFFHINPYACDYSPSSIKGYQEFLAKKYGSIEKLNAVYHQNCGDFSQVDPPRRFAGNKKEDIPFYTDWIEYREYYLVHSLDRLAEMMRERGLREIPMFHNYPHPLGPGGSVSGITTPFNLLALEEKLDFVGFDIYSRKELYEHVKTVVSYVVGSSRYPFIPEFIAGVWPWYLRPGGGEDEEFVTKAALMHGIKGFSRYMIVERNRWLASPVRRDGRVRPERYEVHRRVMTMAKQYNFTDLRRQADVLLLANRDYDRLEAASVLVSFPGDFLEPVLGFSEYPNYMTVSENSLGFEEPVQIGKGNWFMKGYRSLTEAGYAFLLGDTALPIDRLQAYKALVLSSFEYLPSALQQKVVEYVKAGGTVIMGPRLPELNERMEKDETIRSALAGLTTSPLAGGNAYALGKGKLVVLPTLEGAETFEAALQDLNLLRASKSNTRLDVAIHRYLDQNDRLIVFVANPTADTIEAKVGLNAAIKSVKDIGDGQEKPVSGQAWSETFPPYTIKIYECGL